MTASISHAVFLGVTTGGSEVTLPPEVQSRPLRNLVSYLKQKEAAGVISIAGGRVLYCFPPCQFSSDLLRRSASLLTQEEGKEKSDDHLVMLVVEGGGVVN